MTPAAPNIIQEVEALVAAWCDRRALRALRAILSGWPLTNGLTDDWGDLLTALERARAFARDDLSEQEMRTVEKVIHEVQAVIGRRAGGQ